MKLRYEGGSVEKVRVHVKGQPKNVTEEVERDQLSIVFEETEYHWPKPGAVLTVPSNVGGWLLGKAAGKLKEIADDSASERGQPRRMVAVVPEETKKSDPAPAKETRPAAPPAAK